MIKHDPTQFQCWLIYNSISHIPAFTSIYSACGHGMVKQDKLKNYLFVCLSVCVRGQTIPWLQVLHVWNNWLCQVQYPTTNYHLQCTKCKGVKILVKIIVPVITKVIGKGRYGWTRTWMWTRTISKYTFTFTYQLFFTPYIVLQQYLLPDSFVNIQLSIYKWYKVLVFFKCYCPIDYKVLCTYLRNQIQCHRD